MNIGFMKLDPKATIPTKAHTDDLGFDLYALEDVDILAGDVTKVRTGIAMRSPSKFFTNGLLTTLVNYGGILKDRSSVATKQKVFVVAGVIDPQYTGEILVAFANPLNKDVMFKAGDKIAQLVLVASHPADAHEIFEIQPTTRADKGFGSSGT